MVVLMVLTCLSFLHLVCLCITFYTAAGSCAFSSAYNYTKPWYSGKFNHLLSDE